MTAIETAVRIALLGAGATAVMDFWFALLKRTGAQTLNFAFLGRWIAHLLQGRLAHASIAKAPPVPGEMAWGWLAHYVVGIAFAGLLVGLQGVSWMHNPTALPAVAVGVCTVAFPLFVMQPAMGLGIAALRTPAPWRNCLRSMINHTVFGLGLYLAAITVERIFR